VLGCLGSINTRDMILEDLGEAPTRVATIGTLAAIASKIDQGTLFTEGRANTSKQKGIGTPRTCFRQEKPPERRIQ